MESELDEFAELEENIANLEKVLANKKVELFLLKNTVANFNLVHSQPSINSPRDVDEFTEFVKSMREKLDKAKEVFNLNGEE